MFNRLTIIGNLGADPEVRYTSGGTTVTELRVATSEVWKDKQSGEKQERTEWHRVVLFGVVAENAGKYLKKGSKVFIEGPVRTDKWTDSDGNDRYTTKLYGRDLKFLSTRESAGGGGNSQNRQRSVDELPMIVSPPTGAPQQSSMENDFDDDIPF